ncbi:hypothetical protein IFM89_012437 [Coptis chinensis]|uniref:Uncharacterized protein n=1 Tax=Coptis chinensis TaxID=261450 RepID=A0A835IB30_9MAGN|nr:hypothetical protein IFM89_012437 [Coptis chinensis]
MTAIEDITKQKGDHEFQEDSEADEALSFCDLPLSGEYCVDNSDSKQNHDLQTSRDQELFEFFNAVSTGTLSSAEDIVFCGKVFPYRSPPLSNITNKTTQCIEDQRLDIPRKSFLHRKSGSLNDVQRSQSSTKERLTRSTKSLDYGKLHRNSSSKLTRTDSLVQSDERISSGTCFGKCKFSEQRTPSARPRRRVLMFGLVKAPTEMELKDIRNRQSRRMPSPLFPAFDGEETVSVKRVGGKGTWRLLRVLSCKGEANGVITASLSCTPQV